KMVAAYHKGNRKEAMDLQRLVLQVRDLTKMGPTVSILHDILNACGIDAGFGRSPYIEVDHATHEKVISDLKGLGLL
ncbi:MAG: hypothetical protein ABFD07_07290, partial [Methanobacterium sp.]